jgi:hypothetical protein
MSAHAVTLAGYLVLAAAGLGLEVASRRPDSQVPSIRVVLGRIMSTRAGRLAVMAGWAWLGLHFFAL